MGKLIKWIGVFVGVVAVLIIAGVLIIPRVVKVERYKPEIERRISDWAGVPVTLGGKLKLSLVPWVGLSLSDLTLANPEGFEAPSLLQVKAFEVRVRLWPLLSKRLEVKRFVIEEPRVILERDSSGRGNWQEIGRKRPSAEPSAPGQAPRPPGRLPIEALAVAECAIKNGRVLWLDQASGARKEITEIELRLEDVTFQHPIGILFSARIDGQPVVLKGRVGPLGSEPGKGPVPVDVTLEAPGEMTARVQGRVQDPLEGARFDLRLDVPPFSLRTLLEGLGAGAPVKGASPEAFQRVGLKARVQGGPDALSIAEGLLQVDASKLRFALEARKKAPAKLGFDLELDRVNLDRYRGAERAETAPAPSSPKTGGGKPMIPPLAALQTLELDGRVHVGEVTSGALRIHDLSLRLTGKEGRFRLEPFSLRINESPVSVQGTLDLKGDLPGVELDLAAGPLSPRKMCQEMGMPFPVNTADPNAFSHVDFKAKLTANPKLIALTGGELKLDQSRLAFWVKTQDITRPDLAFELDLDQVDVDAYLPPPAGGETKKAPAQPEGKPSAPDYGLLRRIALQGMLKAGTLKLRGTEMHNVLVRVRAGDGVIHLDPASLEVYGGSLGLKAAADVRGDKPKIRADLSAEGVQAGPLLEDQLKKGFLEGVMGAEVRVRAVGLQGGEIKKTLNGEGELLFKDGAIKGVDIPGMVRNVKAAFGLGKKQETRPRTDFSELKGRFTVTDGLVNVSRLTLLSPVLRLNATGKADLVKETLKFRVQPKFVATLKGQGDTMKRSGVMIPVLVGGTFSSPTFMPDVGGMLKQDFIQRFKSKKVLKDTLKDRGKQAGELLKQGFGGTLGGGRSEKAPEKESKAEKKSKPAESVEEAAKNLLKSLPLGK